MHPDPATDWQRSDPDIVVYVPRGEVYHDTDNEHFLVFESPSGDELLSIWTQSSCEGRGDNRAILTQSIASTSFPRYLVPVAGKQFLSIGGGREASYNIRTVEKARTG